MALRGFWSGTHGLRFLTAVHLGGFTVFQSRRDPVAVDAISGERCFVFWDKTGSSSSIRLEETIGPSCPSHQLQARHSAVMKLAGRTVDLLIHLSVRVH